MRNNIITKQSGSFGWKTSVSFLSVCLVFLCVNLLGCAQEGFNDNLLYERVTFVLPNWESCFTMQDYENFHDKKNVPPLDKWKIEFFSDSGIETFYTNDLKLDLKLKKNRIAFVIATPITLDLSNKSYSFFKCCGGIYPQEFKKENRVDMTWESGFCSYVMKLLYNESTRRGLAFEEIVKNLASFNWRKFLDVITEKVEESVVLTQDYLLKDDSSMERPIFYNPWLLDLEELVCSISFGNFSLSKLNQTDVLNVNFNCQNVFSSFVPECRLQGSKQFLSVKKNSITLFSYSNSYGIIVENKEKDFLSVEFIPLPLYN